jgi:hypothetical protein
MTARAAADPCGIGCGGPAVRIVSVVIYELPVSNVGDDAICLFVEPLGDDFWLMREETFIVRTEADPRFSVSSMPGYVIVWINEGDPYEVEVVDQATGEALPCGHGRPSDWPAQSMSSTPSSMPPPLSAQ